ncbi:SWIM zinc finger family protein [Streptomyces sp. NPDC058867]|uniref:SWIM zinc finger family protein n=1 Tax=Streptomyces sp. NPDC058867 TaxID=3346657 RepID=UPI00368A544E
MTARPSEEARRALREARERAGTEDAADAHPSAQSPAPPVRPQGDAPEPRPADAARAALRRQSATGGSASGTEELGEASESTPSRASDVARGALRRPASPGGASDGPSPDAGEAGSAPQPSDPTRSRPADVAREALRAARRDRHRSDAGPQPSRTVPRPQRPPRNDTSAARARALRELLADAFRLPPDTEPVAGAATATEDAEPLEVSGGVGAEPHGAGAEPGGGPAQPGTPGPRASATRTPAAAAEPRPLGSDAFGTVRAAAGQPTPPEPEWRPRTPDRVAAEHSGRPADTSTGPDGPAASRVPRSMAAPSRDGEQRRTFPAFPARGAGDAGFAETWWGNAWVAALEEGALDAGRLARGRAYAEQGHVDAITVTPGLVLAYVQGSRPRPYRVQVRLRTLDDADWERFLDAAAERPGHIAALLDKEMPHSLAEGGVPLLPGPRDLDPRCSCPDSGHPCKHAAALCYQTARLLDADPFVLLLLRGRGERELLDALSRLSATRAARAAQDREPEPLPGVRASEALAPRRLPPLPAPLPVPPHPEQPPVYPAAPGGPDPFALDQLATDAAARAHALLATGRDPLAELTLWQDAVRLAAARPGSGLTAGTRALYASLAAAADRTPAELARAVAAWRQGGPEGLAVLEEPWDPPAGRFDRARPLLLAADLPAFRPWRNHLTHPRGHVQLRLGRDGLWYAYESEPGHDNWWPRGTPDPDPVGALTGLGGPDGP